MMTFKEYMTLFEQISETEIQQITDEIETAVEKVGNYDLDKVILAKNVTTSPQFQVIRDNELQGGPGRFGGQLHAQDDVIKNYRQYFPDADTFPHAEILKFEFVPNFQWFMLLMGFTDKLRLAHMAFSPDLRSAGLIKVVGNALRKHNFRIFPQGGGYEELHSSTEFLDELVAIFRNVAGMGYQVPSSSHSIFSGVKQQYEQLKQKYPQEYTEFLKQKKRLLPNGVFAFRRLGNIPADSQWETPQGQTVPISELKVGDKAFYHPGGNNRYYSQWAEKDKARNMAGVISSDRFEVECHIPTEKIIYTNQLLPAGFSTHVGEGEVIVEHPNPNQSDKQLVCTVTKNRTAGGGW